MLNVDQALNAGKMIAIIAGILYLMAPVALLASTRAGTFSWLGKPFIFLSGLRFLPTKDMVFQIGAETCGAACVINSLDKLGVAHDHGVLAKLQIMSGTSMAELYQALIDHSVNVNSVRWDSIDSFRSEMEGGRLVIMTVEPSYIFWGGNGLYLPLFFVFHWLARKFPQLRHWILVDSSGQDNGDIMITDPYVGRLYYPLKNLRRVWSKLTLIIRKDDVKHEEPRTARSC